MYKKFFKRLADIIISFVGLVLFSWLLLIIAAAVFIDDPGCAIFTQKRVGKGKTYFNLHKFRTMKLSAPHDVPTHLFGEPDKYITRVGRFLRKSSLDELPQLWDILIGKMSLIGPRPALWNQYDLIEERDKYGANDVRPGLTGLAQINGRDELEIADKAEIDGKYVAELNKGGFKALKIDLKCLFGTVSSVLRRNGIIEGGTGAKSQYEKVCK